MKLGFLGTGVISSAVIRAICHSDFKVETIMISPRNVQIAERLALEFSSVVIARDNQQVVDQSDWCCIALRRQIAEEMITGLIFREDQTLISFLPTVSYAQLAQWSKHKGKVIRALPLPFIAEHRMVTPIFPKDEAVFRMFSLIGGALEVAEERHFDLFMTAGSLMGLYFHFSGLCHDWLMEQGMAAEQSGLYLSRLFVNLAEQAANQQPVDFLQLQQEYSTKGGTNEMIARLFDQKGGAICLKDTLDEALTVISSKT